MFGTVFAMLNTSACRPTPRAAASRMVRTKPLIRETTVPAAITALEVSSDFEAAASWARSWPPRACSWALSSGPLTGPLMPAPRDASGGCGCG